MAFNPRPRWALFGWLLLALSSPAWAQGGCAQLPYTLDPAKASAGPKHHPIGRSLPATASFNQPNRCNEAGWFFDQNNNGLLDPGEIRLFGPQRQVDCGSCHGDAGELKTAAAASVYLRQDAGKLCLVCHKI
jgi:predicted CXXCH cytochrome family protein